MKKLLFFGLILSLSACVTTQQTMVSEKSIHPFSVPVMLTLKPVKMDFEFYGRDKNDKILRFSGSKTVTAVGESLVIEMKFKSQEGAIIGMRILSDRFGNLGEWDPLTVNVPLTPEDRKIMDSVLDEMKKGINLGGIQGFHITLPDKPIISGDELYNVDIEIEENPVTFMGIVKGYADFNDRKVIAIETRIHFTNGIEEKIGMSLMDVETGHILKTEFKINGITFVSYQATINN